MRRLYIVVALFAPAALLLLFTLWPQLDAVASLPLFHFYVVTFTTFAAAVISLLLSATLEPIARPRHVLTAIAFVVMAAIFFAHGATTPNAIIDHFHPAVQWSAWLSIFGGGLIFALASLDGPAGPPTWLSNRRVFYAATGATILYLLVVAFVPGGLRQLDAGIEPWHRFMVFLLTALIWLIASYRLWRTWQATRDRVDGTLAFVSFWMAQATVSMHQFPVWQLSWWLYHFILLVAFLFTVYVLAAAYERARQFSLLRYYLAVSLIITALLALVASHVFAEFAYRTLVAGDGRDVAGVVDHSAVAAVDGATVDGYAIAVATMPDEALPAVEVQQIDSLVLRARTTGLLMAAFSMALLFAALLLVVRRADRIIETRTKELSAAYADLRRLEDIRVDLTNMVVHDLRNPLTIIAVSLDLIHRSQDGAGRGTRKDLVERAVVASQRMNGLIDDMLAVSQMESGELEPQFVATTLDQLLSERLEEFVAQTAAGGKTLSHDYPPNLTAQFDPGLIGRVIDNLLSNAFKYTGSDGHIHLSARREAGRVYVRVRDNGPGIPDEYKEQIFHKFIRVPNNPDRPARQGTGLGLAFCRLVIEGHSGQIWVEDASGGGSEFVFWLPQGVVS